MSNAIEIEAKALLDEKGYRKIVSKFPEHTPYEQTNYYIDDDASLLKKEGISLRIRHKEGVYTMTLKTPLSQGLLEKNEPLTLAQFEDFKKGIFPDNDLKRFLTMLDVDVDTLKIVTSLTTKRIDVSYKEGLLSIDENHYSEKTDYEIEFEYNNERDAEAILKELLEETNVPYTLSKKTKVSRALEAVGR